MADRFPCRLIVTPPAAGAWNMAVDEALQRETAEGGLPTLRLYQWEEPTLSLGYFQKKGDILLFLKSRMSPFLVVRRLSGGGAILHDRELTYSLVLPEQHPLAGDTQSLYEATHRAIIAILEPKFDAGAGQLLLCERAVQLPRRDELFLCFLRRARGDILFRCATTGVDHKIVGSAQRRTQGVVLQHGSILLGTSPAAPELAGLCELTGVELSPELLAAELPESFSAALGLCFKPSDLTPRCRHTAAELVDSKYACGRWTAKR